MSFVRAHTVGGRLSQFPFTMQISSTDGIDLQKRSFYREEHIQEGTLIRPVRNYDFGLPALDFKIVNNSTEATLVKELILKVENSQPDVRPVLKWNKKLNIANGDKELILENDGWGPALDSKIENVNGTLFPKGGEKKTIPPFEISLGKIQTKSRDIPLVPLIQDQFKMEKLSDSDKAELTGMLSYAYIDSSGSKKPVTTPFAVEIRNHQTEPEPPAEGPGHNDYQSLQVLDTHRQNYSIPCQVSMNMEPKKAYRFVITLCSRQSAIHDFEVIVGLTNGARIKLGHYRLEFYLPQSQAKMIAEIIKNPSSTQFTSLDGSTDDIPGSNENEDLTQVADKDSNTAVSAENDIASPSAGPEAENNPIPEVSESEKPKRVPGARNEMKTLKANYPYGIAVPGHPDLVESPFAPDKHIDVSGFPHNSVLEDPYTHHFFIAP